jgi:hypothetical protein
MCMVLAFACCDEKGDPASQTGTARPSLQDRLEKSKRSKPSDTELETKAARALFWVKQQLSAEEDVKAAERDLGSKVTAGAAQLGAIKLQEAKEKAASEKSKAEDFMSQLRSMEKAAGKSDPASVCIEQLAEFARINMRSRDIELKYRGITSPRHSELWTEWLYLSISINLAQVVNGEFTPPPKTTVDQ